MKLYNDIRTFWDVNSCESEEGISVVYVHDKR